MSSPVSDFNASFQEDEECLPKALEAMIDQAVAQDFKDGVLKPEPEDLKNDMYKAMKFALECAHVKILYERKVITLNREPFIPKVQYLFGFKPTDGLCIFTQKKAHKIALCDSPIRELARSCFLTQSLMYILVEAKEFRVWSYVPVCCSNDTCPQKGRPFGLRKNLFEP
jgi:hypothetical protein